MDRSLSKLWQIVEDRGAQHAVAPKVARSQAQLSKWTTTKWNIYCRIFTNAKKKEKAQKGVRDCWCVVEQSKLLILNKGFSTCFTEKQKPGGNQSTGPGSCLGEELGRGYSRLGGGNVRSKWAICLAYDRKNGRMLNWSPRGRWAPALLELDFYRE